jgi:hypothetical protein
MILASHGLIASSILQVDPDWLAYYNRVIAAGGSLSTTEQDATKTLVADLKSAGIWSAMKAIYPMVGASAAACAQNLKSSSFTGTFTSGWTFASTGVTPNGTSAYMDTGLNPNGTIGVDSIHLSYYSRTQNTSFAGGAMGTGIAGGNATYLAPYYNGVGAKFFLSGIYPANIASNTTTTTTGLNVGNKNAIDSRKLYLNATLLNTNVISYSYTFANNTFYLGALNYGTAQFFSGFQCAFSSIGDGLTDTQESNLYTAVQAFQTTLSRQV